MVALLFWTVIIIGIGIYLSTRKKNLISGFGLGKPEYETWSHGGYVGLHIATSQIAIRGRIGDSSRRVSKVFSLSRIKSAQWNHNFLYVHVEDMDTPVFRIMMNNASEWAARITQAENAAKNKLQ